MVYPRSPMLVAIHQPHYLPWLRYFEKADRAGVFILLDTVQYSKNGWQNRNRIKTATGAALLTVPVHEARAQAIEDVRICGSGWRKKHWRTIAQAYAHAPFFGQYAAELAVYYDRDWERLGDLNRAMFTWFLTALRIDTRVVAASELRVPGEATERLVNLVREAGGTAYYTGAYALDTYLDPAPFAAAGIELVIQEWRAPVYPQCHGPFVPDLAIVDLLFNLGDGALEVLREGGLTQPRA